MTENRIDPPFTLWVGQDGQPVEKRLSQMTGGEVLQALRWHIDEGKALDREAVAHSEADLLLEAHERGEIESGGLSEAQRTIVAEAGSFYRRRGEHDLRHADLLQRLRAAMPQWQQNPDMSVDVALRRYWPR
jgi:hypothetical protein